MSDKNGEPYGPSGEEHQRNESSKPGGEDRKIEDIPEYVLEGTMLRIDGGDARRQSYGTRPPWWNLRRQPETHPLHVPHHENASNPAGERHCG